MNSKKTENKTARFALVFMLIILAVNIAFAATVEDTFKTMIDSGTLRQKMGTDNKPIPNQYTYKNQDAVLNPDKGTITTTAPAGQTISYAAQKVGNNYIVYTSSTSAGKRTTTALVAGSNGFNTVASIPSITVGEPAPNLQGVIDGSNGNYQITDNNIIYTAEDNSQKITLDSATEQIETINYWYDEKAKKYDTDKVAGNPAFGYDHTVAYPDGTIGRYSYKNDNKDIDYFTRYNAEGDVVQIGDETSFRRFPVEPSTGKTYNCMGCSFAMQTVTLVTGEKQTVNVFITSTGERIPEYEEKNGVLVKSTNAAWNELDVSKQDTSFQQAYNSFNNQYRQIINFGKRAGEFWKEGIGFIPGTEVPVSFGGIEQAYQEWDFLFTWMGADKWSAFNSWKNGYEESGIGQFLSNWGGDWASEVCEQSPDQTNAPSTISMSSSGVPFAHIEGERITAYDENESKYYVYKITFEASSYILLSPEDTLADITINVYDASGAEYPVNMEQGVEGTNKLKLGKNFTFIGTTGSNMIIRPDRKEPPYTEVCLNFGNSGVYLADFKDTLRGGKLCNSFSEEVQTALPGSPSNFLEGLFGLFEGKGFSCSASGCSDDTSGPTAEDDGGKEYTNPTVDNTGSVDSGGGL